MDFNPGQKNTNNTAQPSAPRFPAGGGGGMHMNDGGNKKMMLVGVVVVVVLVLAVLGWWMWGKMGGTESAIMGDRYQALFLTNGQVYFGKLSNIDNKYVKLTDIYYLQVQQTVQPDANKNNNNNQQPQVSLAKLGSELHGPEDSMLVNRDQVLFWENLKNDGKVVQAIQNNQKK